jgi:hypothetical protein
MCIVCFSQELRGQKYWVIWFKKSRFLIVKDSKSVLVFVSSLTFIFYRITVKELKSLFWQCLADLCCGQTVNLAWVAAQWFNTCLTVLRSSVHVQPLLQGPEAVFLVMSDPSMNELWAT